MLRQVLFYIRKQKQIEREVKEALEGNLEVLWLEDMEKIRRQSLDDTLLVTDCADQELPEEFLEMPRLGYGLEYRGSAEYVVENVEALDKTYLEMVYCRYYHLPVIIAETERLLIREMSVQDLDGLYALYDTLNDCPYVEPLYVRQEEEEFTKRYIKNMYGFFGHGLWLIFRKEDYQLIGRAGIENREINGMLEKELGYLIGKPWQKKGYAWKACQAILSYARQQIDCERLFLCSHKENIPSISLAKKLGFSSFAEDIDGMNLYIMEL